MALMDSVFVVWHVSHVYVLDPSDSHVGAFLSVPSFQSCPVGLIVFPAFMTCLQSSQKVSPV